MDLKRGDVVVAVAAGDYGKPRPAIVVQDTSTLGLIESVVVVPLTSTLVADIPFRPEFEPQPETGLAHRSQAVNDKIAAIRIDRKRQRIGHLPPSHMRQLDAALLLILGLELRSQP